jgi:hypothetical protein
MPRLLARSSKFVRLSSNENSTARGGSSDELRRDRRLA